MINIRPVAIQGRWRKGFVLDYHTVGSAYLGADDFGHPVFDTKRTPLGELLYQLKYRSDTTVIAEIADTAAEFYLKWNPGADSIIPVPPTRSGRSLQPVIALVHALSARIGIPAITDCVERTKKIPELKNVFEYDERLRLLEGAYSIRSSSTTGKKVLVFDDLYRSGATMNAIASLLHDQGNAADIFALAITRTRSRL